MTEIVLGMGEVGQTLFDLLTERGFECVGIDEDASKSKNYSAGWEVSDIKDPMYLHVCIPGQLENFAAVVSGWISKFDGTKVVLVHSTVSPGTTKQIQKENENVLVLSSPVRGVHRRFLDDVKRYTKFIGSDRGRPEPEIVTGLQQRFKKICWMSTTKTAEIAKILVDTTYYGWLINYAQITKMICQKEDIDFDEMWTFADEIHENLGNRPKMYPGVIGGHCVIPNLDLVEYDKIDMISAINEMYEEFERSRQSQPKSPSE